MYCVVLPVAKSSSSQSLPKARKQLSSVNPSCVIHFFGRAPTVWCNGVISNPFAWFLHPVGDRCSPLEIVLGRFVICGFFIGVVGFIEKEPRWIILTLQNIEASVPLFLNWAFVICDAGLLELFDIRRFDFDVNTGHQHGATWLTNSSWLSTDGLGWHLHNVEWIYL